MAFRQQLHWLILALICPLIAGAPSSKSKRDGSCPRENLSISRGNFVLSDGYEEGSLLRYSCEKGYYPSVPSLRCENGEWKHPDPEGEKRKKECKKITCPNPRVLKNGEVTPYKLTYHVHDTTTYTCHSDYKLYGSEERVCKPNGKWSGSTPICGRDSDHCPDPGIPAGTTRIGNTFNFGDKVTYQCDRSLTLIGSPVRECQDGGQWSGTEPQCYASFTYDTAEEAAEAFGSSLKTNLMDSGIQDEEKDNYGKKIHLDANGNLDIYFAVHASDSIDDFYWSKQIIKTLINQISYYDVSPNYEILIFAAEVTRIVAMKDFKRNYTFARDLAKVFEDLDKYDFDKDKGTRTGTNIAAAYKAILDSIEVEKENDKNFLETQHIVIMFTDGQANTGGSPIPKVTQIKSLVIQSKPERERKLDLYVFGFGDVKQDEVNGMISHKDREKHFFKLKDLKEVQKTLEEMIDESTSVELCGIHQHWDKSDTSRRAYPWLAQINVIRPSQRSSCMGSLVSSSFILTAAQCFKAGDTASMVTVQLQKGLVVKVKEIITHSEFKVDSKKDKGIIEYYENDIALLQLEKPVQMNYKLRPICIPCTKQTHSALKLPDSEGTCNKHEEILLSKELVEAAFTSKMVKNKDNPRKIRRITIKRGKLKDACFQDALKAEGMNVTDVREVVSDNFLCSGGTEPTTDDVACRGEAGGATHMLKKGRLIQVGIVSWGVKNLCTDRTLDANSIDESRDYHTNLFSEKMQSFLKEHLGDAKKGSPLEFLPMIDEVELCGVHQPLDKSDKSRPAYPWLAQIHVLRPIKSTNCMGSLVTSSFILTAAHCFKAGDTASMVTVQLQKGLAVKVKEIITHSEFQMNSKKDKGIKEYYENDIALLLLEKPVQMNYQLRPICIPCTNQTNRALKLTDSEGTCKKHEEILLSKELVEAAFTSEMVENKDNPRKIRRITIKRGKLRDACFQDALKAEGVKVTTVSEVVSDNFLCSGGTEPTTDDVACKGDSGGATHVLNKDRFIQVGIVSWGVKNLCTDKTLDAKSIDESRDYHTNLFSEKMQLFLKEHLGDAKKGSPLDFFANEV